MFSKYIHALDSLDSWTQHFLHKQSKKRALGDLSYRSAYSAPQSVLSVKLHMNRSSTSINGKEGLNSLEIIDMQHQQLHSFLLKTRESKSALTRKSKCNFEKSKKHQEKVPSIEISGINVTNRNRDKNDTQKQPKVPRKYLQSAVIQRKRSQVSIINPNSVTDLMESSRSQKELNNRIRNLDNYDFGQEQLSTTSGFRKSDSNTAWLTFGGAQTENSHGILDAFTSSFGKSGMFQCYQIDSATGSHVAKQLQPGDKIRIGINGEVHCCKSMTKTHKNKKERENVCGMSDYFVPLSWDDQLSRPEVKIIEPRLVQPQITKANSCETHPVIFHQKLKDENTSSQTLSDQFYTNCQPDSTLKISNTFLNNEKYYEVSSQLEPKLDSEEEMYNDSSSDNEDKDSQYHNSKQKLMLIHSNKIGVNSATTDSKCSQVRSEKNIHQVLEKKEIQISIPSRKPVNHITDLSILGPCYSEEKNYQDTGICTKGSKLSSRKSVSKLAFVKTSPTNGQKDTEFIHICGSVPTGNCNSRKFTGTDKETVYPQDVNELENKMHKHSSHLSPINTDPFMNEETTAARSCASVVEIPTAERLWDVDSLSFDSHPDESQLVFR